MGKHKSKAPKKYVRPTEPINARASQAFGLRIAEFFHRDIKTVLQTDSAESSGSSSTRLQLQEKRSIKSTTPKLDSKAERHRAIAHAKLVREQLRQRKKAQWPAVKQIIKPLSFPKGPNSRQPVFQFTSLPPEIREMILAHFFSNRTSWKQSLLEALRGYGDPDLYGMAKRIWCQESVFPFTLEQTRVNEFLDGLDQVHMDYLRRINVVITRTITPTTSLSPSLFRAHNISILTLNVYSSLGFKKAIHGLVVHFRHLQIVKARVYRLRGDSMHGYLDAKKDLNRVLDGKGVLVSQARGKVVWVWDLSKEKDRRKVFEPKRMKARIKFSG